MENKNLFDDFFVTEEELQNGYFKNKKFKPSILWNFYVKKCNEYFPDIILPKRVSVKVLCNLKCLVKEYGEKNARKYLEICIKDWNLFKKKYNKTNFFPSFSDIFFFRERELSSCIKFNSIQLKSNIFRGNDNRTKEIEEWLEKNDR